MRKSDYKRGEFILSRIQHYLLIDLGKEEIDAEQAGYVFDLMVWSQRNGKLFSNGVTTEEDLANNPYYLKALKDWQNYLLIRRQELEAKHGKITTTA